MSTEAVSEKRSSEEEEEEEVTPTGTGNAIIGPRLVRQEPFCGVPMGAALGWIKKPRNQGVQTEVKPTPGLCKG